MGRNKKKKRKMGPKPKLNDIDVKDVINFSGWKSSFECKAESHSSSSSSASSPPSSMSVNFANESPFPHIRLEKFISSEEFLKEVSQELLKATQGGSATIYNKKSNDLYDFLQSEDLANCTTPCIVKLRDALYSQEFRDFLESTTGIKTSQQVDMTSAIYRKRNRLLCHDDQLDSRRIAYILYLTPDWTESDGGALDFFGTDENGAPSTVVKSLTPIWNSLVFFQVSEKSYHQVAEVLSAKNRLTVGGWFHGEPLEFESPQYISTKPPFNPFHQSEMKLQDWISPKYLRENVDEEILGQFMEEGSISLEGFLKSNKYTALVKAFQQRNWKLIGPANRNHYYEPTEAKAEDIIDQVRELMTSSQFKDLVNSWTSLDLTDVSVSVRKFEKSCYTLCSDADQKELAEGLDVILCCPSTDRIWGTDHGGSIHYLDSDEELLTVVPGENTLSLAYREDGTIMQFVRYVSSTAKSTRFDIKTVFHVEEGSDNDEMKDEGGDGDGDESMNAPQNSEGEN